MPRPSGPFPQTTPVLGETEGRENPQIPVMGFFNPFDAAEHRSLHWVKRKFV
jgi:hypothetical protein